MYSRKNIKLLLSIILLTLLILMFAPTVMVAKTNKALAENEKVYLGGYPVGLDIKGDGLLVENFRPIISTDGTFTPAKESGILVGDIITHANEIKISSPIELQKEVDKSNDYIILGVTRGNAKLSFNIKPVFDPISGDKKLGIIVKNYISGIGTLTYVDKNGNYCSLGHKICDINCNNVDFYQSGDIFSANILGSHKGENGEAGALKGIFDRKEPAIGKISKNTDFGVYGKIEKMNDYKTSNLVEFGAREQVKLGKAYIYSTIEGNTPQKYDIEIIKAYNQDTPNVKSMVIRVTDQRLIESCGGIVQGMSGSPILQNDKLIGAVTHVFLNDATIGYGVYIDWLK